MRIVCNLHGLVAPEVLLHMLLSLSFWAYREALPGLSLANKIERPVLVGHHAHS